MPPQPKYCTIIARNYPAKALTLGDSLKRLADAPLTVLVIDAPDEAALPHADGVDLIGTSSALGLSQRELLDLAMGYDLVELATAVKPVLLAKLLEMSEQVVYLDPDTYLTAELAELPGAIAASAGGIVLTPHYLTPAPSGGHYFEGHLLVVGVYNLGFCAVDRRARDFLAWWWGHLREECLHDPLSGLFGDQKWVDIGGVLFQGTALRHAGYNVSVANLHERPLAMDADGLYIATTGERLRLFHFHGYSAATPDRLTVRGPAPHEAIAASDPAAIDALLRQYGDELSRNERLVEPSPPYRYASDTTGRRISRRLRRAYRADLRAGASPPSPFVPADAARYESWRRRAWRTVGHQLAEDAVKSVRCALPEEYGRLKDRLPGLADAVRRRYVSRGGMWR